MQDLNNDIVSGAFRITGLFDTKTQSFDESIVFITYRDASSLIGLPAGAAHEIAVRTTGNEQINKVYEKVKSDNSGLEVLTWSELSPELWFLTETMNYLMYILFVIILMALLFGLVNTMLMVVLERKREIGILMAVGMNKVRIFTMIVFETVLLALTGGFSGILAGTVISKYFETHVIDLSKMGNSIEDMGFDSLVNTSVDLRLIAIVAMLVVLTGILGSLFPAFKALKNNPSETIRTE
jgi:ABC-type lipoprotein release transport system permease subunit